MLRRLHICIYFLIFAALMMLHGCDKCELASGEKDASLQIRLNAPSYLAELKSVSSVPNSPENWSKWERAVDGRFMYRVTAFLLQGNRLVAHKDLTLDGEPDQATIDFEANFTHGAYTLMVVANYSAFEAEDGGDVTMHYNGITGFASTVEEILTHSTIDNFTNTYADSFMNFQIESTNGVCRRVPQPLTLVKEIELHPGTNVISGELLRTYSRIRISVENSSDENLMLNSMSFQDVFTQTKEYIFAGRGYPGQKVAIDVASANALTPFTGTEADPMVIPAQEMSVIFDAYVLESSKNSIGSYTYSLGIEYEQLSSYKLSSTTAIKRKANVTAGRYLMYNRGTGTYLMANSTTSVSTGNPGTLKVGMSIPKEYVWSLDNNGLSANRFYIGTAEALDEGQTSYYMYISSPSSRNSAVKLGATPSYYFTVADAGSGSNQYITFQSSGSGNYRYLGTNNGSVVGQQSSNNAHFLLYPVEVVPTASEATIPVRTINQATGQPEDVEQINRNDFINAVVKVSYSKNQGHFIYEVKDWNTGGGDVNFN